MRITVEAGKNGRRYWQDLWRYRELFYFLAWRDVVVRYKQTAIGLAWAVIRPLLTTIVFTLVFGQLGGLSSGDAPYALLVLAGMLPWQFFATAFSESANSLISDASIVSKVYFPRIVIPVSAVLSSVVDLLVSLVLLVLLMFWYAYLPSIRMLALPLFFVLAVLASIGAGLWLAALNVKYRDFRYVIPFIVQIGFYISPVGFASDLVPGNWRLLYSLNPMVGAIDGFRWAVLDNGYPLYVPGLLISMTVVAVVLISGVWYFRKAETAFADVI